MQQDRAVLEQSASYPELSAADQFPAGTHDLAPYGLREAGPGIERGRPSLRG
jgi:hypothetical protein